MLRVVVCVGFSFPENCVISGHPHTHSTIGLFCCLALFLFEVLLKKHHFTFDFYFTAGFLNFSLKHFWRFHSFILQIKSMFISLTWPWPLVSSWCNSCTLSFCLSLRQFTLNVKYSHINYCSLSSIVLHNWNTLTKYTTMTPMFLLPAPATNLYWADFCWLIKQQETWDVLSLPSKGSSWQHDIMLLLWCAEVIIHLWQVS